MPSHSNAGLIRLGIFALPLGGVLGLVGSLGELGTPDAEADPRGAAQAAVSTGYFLTQFVGNILGVTLVVFGIFALFAYLTNTSGRRLALWAMILSVTGFCLLLAFLGIITLAIPALAQEYLNGQQEALQMTGAFFDSKTFVVISLANLLFLVGFILFGVAIWRSETLPKWAGVLLAVSGLLLAVPADLPVVSLLGTVLLIIAGGWIALSVVRRPSAQGTGDEAQPRVR